jgi:hypothetical protein
MCKWGHWLKSILQWFDLNYRPDSRGIYSLENMAREACLELKTAQELLDRVTEPDLIEYAVYSIKAAEKRCDYLIKKLREQGEQYSM